MHVGGFTNMHYHFADTDRSTLQIVAFHAICYTVKNCTSCASENDDVQAAQGHR